MEVLGRLRDQLTHNRDVLADLVTAEDGMPDHAVDDNAGDQSPPALDSFLELAPQFEWSTQENRTLAPPWSPASPSASSLPSCPGMRRF